MKIEGDYERDGYAFVREMVPPEVARAFMAQLRRDLPPNPTRPAPGVPVSPILKRHAAGEIYGGTYPPMLTFLWALTGAMEQVTGRRLLPTYDYLRFYQESDICRVHRDRPACEHSLSLTLDYSDGVPWPLEVGKLGNKGGAAPIADDFGEEPFTALPMEIGDAVAYKRTIHRHGRTTPNHNAWSAHLFLHWVEREGPHADQVFDGAGIPQPVNFTF